MAPSTRPDMVVKAAEKEEIFVDVKTSGIVPEDFVSHKTAEREFGLSLQVYLS